MDQIKSEPSIPRTKISDFDILSLDGQSMTDFILDESRYNLMIISPKVKYESSVIEEERIDTIYKMDTTIIKLKKRDSLVISKQVAGTQSKI